MEKLDFNFIYAAQKARYEDPPDVREKEEQNKKIEDRLLKELNLCKNQDQYVEEVATLDPDVIQKFANKDFYDHDFVENVLCLVNTGIYTAKYSGVGIRNYFTNLKRIGSGSLGNAFESDFDEIKNSIIIKAPKDAKDDLTHEMLVGLYGTNKLRKEIPNFAYIYGGFDCSAPLIDGQSNVLTWCNISGPGVKYVIYEKVPNAETMGKFMKRSDISVKDQISVLIQIILALLYANKTIDFTHYDLNYDNILIRRLPGTYRIKYPNPTSQGSSSQGSYYVLSNYVAQIIDYGFSHIKTERGESIGYNYSDYYVDNEKSFPIGDIYKLLAFLREHPLANILLRYFYKEFPNKSISNSIAQQDQYYYFLPNIPQTEKFTLLGLFEFAKANMPYINNILLNENSRTDIAILDCASLCPSPEDFKGSGIPTSTINFYNLIVSLKSDKKKQEYIDKFSYTTPIQKSLDEISNTYNSIIDYVKEAQEMIKEGNFIIRYPFFFDVIKAMDFTKLLINNIKITMYVCEIYKDKNAILYLKNKRKAIEFEIIPKLINIRRKIMETQLFLDYDFKINYDNDRVPLPKIDKYGNVENHPNLFFSLGQIDVKWVEIFQRSDYYNMNTNPGDFFEIIANFNPADF